MVAIKRLITFYAIDTCRLLFAALAILSPTATNFVRMVWKVYNEKKGAQLCWSMLMIIPCGLSLKTRG